MSDGSTTSGKRFSVGIVAGVLLAGAVAGAAYLTMRDQGQQAAGNMAAGGEGQGTAALPPNHPPIPQGAVPVTGGMPGMGMGAAGAADSQGEMISGRVAEVLQVPGYTYLKLETGGSETWTAVSTTEVQTGTVVVVTDAFLMQNFHSKTLQRSFDKIYFGSIDGR